MDKNNKKKACILAYHEMEGARNRLELAYFCFEQKKKICDAIDELAKLYKVSPAQMNILKSETEGEIHVEFFEYNDRSSLLFFDGLIAKLDIGKCE